MCTRCYRRSAHLSRHPPIAGQHVAANLVGEGEGVPRSRGPRGVLENFRTNEIANIARVRPTGKYERYCVRAQKYTGKQ